MIVDSEIKTSRLIKHFGTDYKRKKSGQPKKTGTAGFYPERNIYNCIKLLSIACPSFFTGKRFIDIGCGIGNALYAFSDFGFKGHLFGIDIDYELLKIARRNLPLDIHVFCGDAREYSFCKFDRIYTFNPAQRMPVNFYESIWESLSKNTIWIETKAKYIPKWMFSYDKKILIPRQDKSYHMIILIK